VAGRPTRPDLTRRPPIPSDLDWLRWP
jgi:hypothetical protein